MRDCRPAAFWSSSQAKNEITGVCRKLEGRYGKEAIATRKRRRAVPSVQEEETVDAAPQAMKVAPTVGAYSVSSSAHNLREDCL